MELEARAGQELESPRLIDGFKSSKTITIISGLRTVQEVSGLQYKNPKPKKPKKNGHRYTGTVKAQKKMNNCN